MKNIYEDRKICSYFNNNELSIDKVISDFEDYVYVIIKNSSSKIKEEDIEEIKLDVFFTIWKNQNKLQKEKEMSPYISAVTKNLILKKYRTLKKENSNSLEDNYNNIENETKFTIDLEVELINNEKIKILEKNLKEMKKENQDIFFLYYYEGLKISEISKRLGFSIPKIKAKLFKTRRKLKKVLEERGYYE